MKTEFPILKVRKGVIMQGKVKWFNQEKGFGFIVGDDNKEYFVHYTQIQIAGFKTLEEGALVEFDPIEIEKGLQAKNVVKKEVSVV